MDMHYYETSVGGFVPWRGNISGSISSSAGTSGAGGTAIVQGNFATGGTSAAGGTAIVQGNFAVGTSATGGTSIVQFTPQTTVITGTVALLGSGAAGTAFVTGSVALIGTSIVILSATANVAGAFGTQSTGGTAIVQFTPQTTVITGTVALLGSGAAGTAFVTGSVALIGTSLVAMSSTALISGAVTVSNTAVVSLSTATLSVLVSQGTPYGIIMKPQVQSDASSTNAAQFLSDSTGWNQLSFFLLGVVTPSGASVTITWSTTVNDQSSVKSTIDSITTLTTGKSFTPDGSLVLNTVTLPVGPSTAPIFQITMDTSTPIKTFGVEFDLPVPNGRVSVVGLKAA